MLVETIAGFHMTSLKLKLQNYRSSSYFTFMMYKRKLSRKSGMTCRDLYFCKFISIKGGFNGSVHVSKSKYFCSLLINVIASKILLRYSSVITCYS